MQSGNANLGLAMNNVEPERSAAWSKENWFACFQRFCRSSLALKQIKEFSGHRLVGWPHEELETISLHLT
jgi:hypothetical protein